MNRSDKRDVGFKFTKNQSPIAITGGANVHGSKLVE